MEGQNMAHLDVPVETTTAERQIKRAYSSV
jgi:hypothetical protein